MFNQTRTHEEYDIFMITYMVKQHEALNLNLVSEVASRNLYVFGWAHTAFVGHLLAVWLVPIPMFLRRPASQGSLVLHKIHTYHA